MRKMVFVLFVLFSLTACTSGVGDLLDSTISNEVEVSGEYEIIDSGKYYRIFKEPGEFEEMFCIFNDKGETVLEDKTDRPLSIKMINESVVEISKGLGTGLSEKQYYDAQREVFSEKYTYVIAVSKKIIAFIDTSMENPMEDRQVVVRNIFDKDEYFKMFSLDFYQTDTPVEEALFSEDGKVLRITYMSKENGRLTTAWIDLQE